MLREARMASGGASSDLIDFLFLPIGSTQWSAYAWLDQVDRHESQVILAVRFETHEAGHPHPYYSYAAVFELGVCRYGCVAARNVATSGYVGGGPMLHYVIEKFLAQKLIPLEAYPEKIFNLKPGAQWPPTEQDIRRIIAEGLPSWVTQRGARRFQEAHRDLIADALQSATDADQSAQAEQGDSA
jgi:hypothetical protein